MIDDTGSIAAVAAKTLNLESMHQSVLQGEEINGHIQWTLYYICVCVRAYARKENLYITFTSF